VQFLLFVMSDV